MQIVKRWQIQKVFLYCVLPQEQLGLVLFQSAASVQRIAAAADRRSNSHNSTGEDHRGNRRSLGPIRSQIKRLSGLPHWGWVPSVIVCWQIKVRGHRKQRKGTHAHTHNDEERLWDNRTELDLWSCHNWLRVSEVALICRWRDDWNTDGWEYFAI